MKHTTLRLYDGYTNTSPELKEEVKELQRQLKEEGFKVKVDGLFGRDTEEAVKRFQRDNNLDDDGIAGPRTWAILLNETVTETSNLFSTTFARENKSLKEQLNEAERYKKFIFSSASVHGLQPSVIAGIGSRESKWGLALIPAGPGGTGDTIKRRFPTRYRTGPMPPDGGFGRGLMQVDFDAHEFARTGDWKNPEANINYGCKVLAESISFIKNKTGLEDEMLLRAGIAGYNCGPGNALRAIRDKLDIDYFTFGRNYSANVLNRAGWFQLYDWE